MLVSERRKDVDHALSESKGVAYLPAIGGCV